MNSLMVLSSTLITLALIFYSVGVWSEKIARYLKGWHLIAFWCGFAFDLGGTYSMHLMSDGPMDFFNMHTLTGQIAIWLMLIHALWATYVVIKSKESLRTSFHRYSIIVWLIWLVPYFGGMYAGMSK